MGLAVVQHGQRKPSDHTIDRAGERSLIGAPGGYSGAGMPTSPPADGTYLYREYRPFEFNSTLNQMETSTRTSLNFGVGTALISEQFAIVGTDNADAYNNLVYNFRQRGPQWNVSGSTVTPARLPTAKLGADVSIDGDTAVLGAPDYDGRGAAFVYTNLPGTDTWQLQSLVQPEVLDRNDRFGATVALSGDTLVISAPGTVAETARSSSTSVWAKSGDNRPNCGAR